MRSSRTPSTTMWAQRTSEKDGWPHASRRIVDITSVSEIRAPLQCNPNDAFVHQILPEFRRWSSSTAAAVPAKRRRRCFPDRRRFGQSAARPDRCRKQRPGLQDHKSGRVSTRIRVGSAISTRRCPMAVKPDRKAINMKSFASSFIAFVLLANSSPALCDEAALLQMLKKNPAGNPETAHWFASLSLQKKEGICRTDRPHRLGS